MKIRERICELFGCQRLSVPVGREHTASAILSLVTDFQSWVYRRVESITVLDDISVHRRVSLDYQMPEDLNLPVDARLVPSVPLTFLRKEVLRNFDLHDEEDRPIPMLTKSENGTVAGDTLVVAAETVLGNAVPGAIEGRLRRVAEGNIEQAGEERREWFRLARDALNPHRDQWERLVSDAGFRAYSAHLVEHFILLAVTDPAPGRRRLLKLSYEERFEHKEPTGRQRALVQLGWKRKEIAFAAPAVTLAASFHFEIAAPEEMEIDVARLRLRRAGDQKPAASTDEPIDGPLVQRAHLYASHVEPELVGEALIYLRARRAGFLRAATLTGLLMASLLGLGFAFLDDITSKNTSQTAAALFLLGPTLLAAGLIRPGEHRLVSSVLGGVRIMLSVAVLATVFAVALLAGVAQEIRDWLWLGATTVAGLMALGLVLSYVLPRPTKLEE